MSTVNPMPLAWFDSATFWQDKRVSVTSGSGFSGSSVIDTLHVGDAANVLVPRCADYDQRNTDAFR